jgi:hypothetical protein
VEGGPDLSPGDHEVVFVADPSVCDVRRDTDDHHEVDRRYRDVR